MTPGLAHGEDPGAIGAALDPPYATRPNAARGQPELSVVVSVYGCASSVRELHARLTATLVEAVDEWEIILVDDRATDGSWEIIDAVARADPRVVAIRLSRNFGQQAAIAAGIAHAAGQWVAIMDCDLQDPPELLPRLLEEGRKGADVVLARRKNQYHGVARQIANYVYFRLLSLMSGTRTDGEFGSLGLMSHKVARAYRQFSETDRHHMFIVNWLGFDARTIEYQRAHRADGQGAYTLAALFNLAVSGIFFQTTRLLRWVVYMGFAISLTGFPLGLYLAIGTLFLERTPPPGWTALIVVNLFLGGIIIISVGIVGLYVSRVFQQVKARPLYIVDELVRVGETEQSADPGIP